MPGYCGVNDVRRGLTGSAEAGGADRGGAPTNTAADLDDEAIQDSIDEATALVDAYIDGPYDVAIEKVPNYVRFWTRDIASYYATLVWRKSKAPTPSDPVVLRYQHTLDMLQSVAQGELAILGPQDVEDQPTVVNPMSPLVTLANISNINNLQLINPWNFDLWGRSEYGGDYYGAGSFPGGIRVTYVPEPFRLD